MGQQWHRVLKTVGVAGGYKWRQYHQRKS